MNDWHNVYITDKTGKKGFNTVASPMSTMSEIRNLKRHIEQVKRHPEHYKSFDVDSMVLMIDGVPYGEPQNMTDDELLAKLMA